MATTAPVELQRFTSLDAIRGVAVMGILAMNIYAFSTPDPGYTNPAAVGDDTGGNVVVWLLDFLFFDSKMRGLFSMMFGASTLLVIERAVAYGLSGAKVHYSRMVWLLILGLAHFYLIWWGDILVLYALCGMLLFFFRNLSIRALRRWAIGFLIVSTLYFGSFFGSAALMRAGVFEPPAAMAEAMVEVNDKMGPHSPDVATTRALYRSGYQAIAGNRIFEKTAEPIAGFMTFGWETLGLMLIGMIMFKSGFFTGQWDSARYRKWLLVCWGVAIPVNLLLAWYQLSDGYSGVSTLFATLVLSMPFDIMMAIGWAALVILVIRQARYARLGARLAATGRMAFTNYLVTSLVMTTIFYGYGLSLFGEFHRLALQLFVLAMWGAMMAWSKPWLDRYNYGPFEWLWRSLARWRFQPMWRAPVAGA